MTSKASSTRSALHGELLLERLSVTEVCRYCSVEQELLLRFVQEGIVEPEGDQPENWLFEWQHIRRIRQVQRLRNDLGINLPGAALAIELLERIERLEHRLHTLPR